MQTVNSLWHTLTENRALRWLALVVAAVLPAAVAFILITFKIDARMTDFVPRSNDEIGYWHMIATANRVGFQGGYYALNEVPAPATFSHFDSYGPWYPTIIGNLARVTGWNLYTGPILNMLLLTVGLLLFGYFARLDTKQLIALGIFTVTFWPTLVSLTTGYQEIFQQFLAILLALIFYRLLKPQAELSGRFTILAFVFIFFACLTRISWAILFVPFFILIDRPKHWLGIIVSLIKSLAAGLVVLAIETYFAVPGNHSFEEVILAFRVSIGHGIEVFTRTFFANITGYLDMARPSMEVLFSFQVLALIVIFSAVVIWLYLGRRRGEVDENTALLSEMAFHDYNIAAILVMSLALYLVGTGGDYRIISAHVFLTFLLLIALRRYALVAALVVVNLLFTPQFLIFQRDTAYVRFFYPHEKIVAFAEAIDDYIAYDSEAESAWCNTLLLHIGDYTTELTAVPAGIGLSYILESDDPKLEFPLKSKYILMDEVEAAMLKNRGAKLEFLTETLLANLYFNPDSGCSQ